MWTVAWPHSVPPWVAVSSEALNDLYWLAVRARLEVPSSDRAAATAATVSWLHGGQDAPITGRPAGMVSSSAAEAELWAARRVTEPEAVDLEWITGALGVRYLRPNPVSMIWAVGVAQTLDWVMGPARYALPPMDLPRRGPDGKLRTVEELYQVARARRSGRWGPAERIEAHRNAELAVTRSRRLARLIDATRHRVQTSQPPPSVIPIVPPSLPEHPTDRPHHREVEHEMVESPSSGPPDRRWRRMLVADGGG